MNPMLSRRSALRLLGGSALAALPVIGRIDSAAAGRSWCRVDPLFYIGGHLFDVAIASDVAMLAAATGPVQVALTVPVGVPAEVIFQDSGFGHGYDVTIAESKRLKATEHSLALMVVVVAPASDGSLPVEVTLTSLDADAWVSQTVVTGVANQPVVWRGKIDAITLDQLIRG